MTRHAFLTSFCTVALAISMTGCCGGGEPTPKCESKLKFDKSNPSGEKPFRAWGTGKTKDEALKNSCWDYCRYADSEFDAKYRISVDAMKKKGRKIIPAKKDRHRFDAE